MAHGLGLNLNSSRSQPLRSDITDPDDGRLREGLLDTSNSGPYSLSAAAPPQKQNRAYLHGLRGLAALIVYIAHNIAWWYGPAGPVEEGFGYHGHYMIATFPFIRTFFSGGGAAVSVFFVLSGYVLSLSTLQLLRVHDSERAAGGPGRQREIWRGLISATIRRPFRLFMPLGAVSLALAFVMELPLIAPHMIWPKAEPSLILELWTWVKEMVKIMNPLRRYGGNAVWFRYSMAAWTMSAEFKGSLAVFAMLGIYSHAPPRYRFSLFALTGWIFLYLASDWVVACFMWGTCLAMLDTNTSSSPSSSYSSSSSSPSLLGSLRRLLNSNSTMRSILNDKRTKPAFFLSLFILSWWLLGQPSNLNPERSAATPGWGWVTYHLIPYRYLRTEHWRFFNTIAATSLVYSLSNLPVLQDIFSLPSMQFLGKISFMLYLVHMPMIWTIGDRIYRMLGVQRGDFVTIFDDLFKIPDVGPVGFSTGWIISQMLVYPLNAALALVLVRLIDEPSVRIGKQVAAKLMPSVIKREDRFIRAFNRLTGRFTSKLHALVPASLVHTITSAIPVPLSTFVTNAVATATTTTTTTTTTNTITANGSASISNSSESSTRGLNGNEGGLSAGDLERQQGKIQ